MKLKLLDYENRPTEFEIGDLDEIMVISIRIISGDEVATVYYKDKAMKIFDPNDHKTINVDRTITMDQTSNNDYGVYFIYFMGCDNNLIDSPLWMYRTSSYDYCAHDNIEKE